MRLNNLLKFNWRTFTKADWATYGNAYDELSDCDAPLLYEDLENELVYIAETHCVTCIKYAHGIGGVDQLTTYVLVDTVSTPL